MRKLTTPCRGASVSVTIATVLFLVIGSFSAHASNIPASGWYNLSGAQAEGVAIKASPSDAAAMSVSFTLPGFSSERVSLNNENWHSITFPGQCKTDVIGAPGLPLMRRFFAVPAGAAVTVEVTGVEFETFEKVKVEPHQRPLLETESAADRTFTINKQLYSTDRYYPEAWASTSETIVMRGVHLATLMINPFRYNPVSGTMQAASRITCKVTYTGSNAGKTLTFPSNLANTFKALLLNYDFMEYTMIPGKAKMNNSRATDYLIITDGDFMDAASLTNLVSYYTSQGFTVELKNVSDIGTSADADAIKGYIETVYGAGELDYVLLVGDLPAITHKVDAYSGKDSDSWYSWLDGDDLVGDVGLGRMPATDETELSYMVAKTLDFQTLAYPGEWRKKSILIAHREDYPEKYTACKESIYDHDYILEPPVMDRKYGGENATNAQVTEAINEGRLVVNYRGHGSRTSWSGWNGSSYSTSDASALENGKMTPVVFCMACTNGDMSSSSDCLAEAFICQEEGAVAILAANDPSMTTVNHTYDRALYYGTWDEGIEAAGDLRNHADAEAIAQHGNTAKGNVAMYIWFGDPLINILKGSSEPFINVYSPAGGERWEQGTTQEIKWGDNIDGNVMIELFKGGSLKETLAASIASNGSLEWQIAGDYDTGDDYKVKITSIDSTALNDESDTNFSIIPEYIIVCPYFQNFDTLEAQSDILPFKYEQLSDDDLNWIVYSGPTPSRIDDPPDVTGPMADHTTGTDQGIYIYTEASASNNGNPNKKFTFVTPKFNFKSLGDPTLSFWYHMFSDNAGEDHMGDLIVDISVDGIWQNDVITISGNKGDNWLEETLDLEPYKGDRVIFRLRGITGDSWESDISVDDFKIDGVVPIINSLAKVPASFNLKYNGSRIYFQVPNNGNNTSLVTLKLYNLQGKLVSTLVSGNVKAGYHSISLDKMNRTGQSIAAGMYLCRMETKDFTKTINILFRK